jgi:hypothetical protein
VNLHCPARILVVRPDGVPDVSGLADRRIAAVYASSHAPAQAVAGRLAELLGVRSSVVMTLDDPAAGFDLAVQEIGDLHPGETVLAVTPSIEPMEIEYDGLGWSREPPSRQ